jgi:DNA-binding transcriptional regulator YdaS (Cro superfamily)
MKSTPKPIEEAPDEGLPASSRLAPGTDEPEFIQLAIDAVGGVSQLAKLCKVSYQAVQKWQATGRPPAERVLEIERVTGISRHDLRPDIYPREFA